MNPKYMPDDGLVAGLAAFTPEGIPIRQGALPLRSEEMDLLGRSADYHVKDFDLGDPEQLEKYHEVMDRLVNNKSRFRLLAPRTRGWNTETNSFHVLVEWCEVFAEVPSRLRRRMERPR